MMILAVVPFVLALAVDEPSPPSAAPSESKPPVVELAPTPSPTPKTTMPPPVATPSPTPAPDKRAPPQKVVDKYGLSPVSTGLIQVAAGCGACCLGGCASIPVGLGLGLIPVVGAYASNVAADVIQGVAAGATEGILGDVIGQERSAIAWPTLFAVGMFLGDTATTLALSAVYKVSLATIPQDQAGLQRFINANAGYFALRATSGIVFTTAAIVGPAIVYSVTAVDKKPGDEGQGFPGIFQPADPQPKDTKAITIAMAY